MASRTLRTRDTLPLHLEVRLVQKWGYAVEKRMHGDHILFKKSYISDKTTIANDVVKVNPKEVESVVYPDFLTRTNGLTKYQRSQLENRCDNIVGHFPDPYSVPNAVRARLMIMMQRLTNAEQDFVLQYMNENFPDATNKGVIK